MAIVATDNFNRANGGLGANWTTQTAYTAPLIVSNAIQSLALTDYAAVYTAADAGSDDMYCKVDSTVVTSAANNDNIVWVRMPNTGAETGYMADSPSFGTKDWTLQKATAGAFTVLATGGGIAVAASTFSLQVQAVGTTISASRGGTSLASVTDSTFSGSSNRYAGIHVYADSTNFCSIDNFEMGSISSAAKTPSVSTPKHIGVLARRGRVAFVQPNQTPPTWLPPRPYTIRRRVFSAVLGRRRGPVQVPLTQIVVTVPSVPPIKATRRASVLPSRRREQPVVPVTVCVSVPSIKTTRRAIPLLRRRQQPSTPLTQTVQVALWVPQIGTARRPIPRTRRGSVTPTPPVIVVVSVPQPRVSTRRTFAGLQRRGHVAFLAPSQVAVMVVPPPLPTITARRPLGLFARRRGRVIATPLTQIVVTVPSVPPVTRRRASWLPVARGRVIATPLTQTTTIVVNVPPVARRRSGWLPPKRGRVVTTPVVVTVTIPPIQRRRGLWLNRKRGKTTQFVTYVAPVITTLSGGYGVIYSAKVNQGSISSAAVNPASVASVTVNQETIKSAALNRDAINSANVNQGSIGSVQL